MRGGEEACGGGGGCSMVMAKAGGFEVSVEGGGRRCEGPFPTQLTDNHVRARHKHSDGGPVGARIILPSGREVVNRVRVKLGNVLVNVGGVQPHRVVHERVVGRHVAKFVREDLRWCSVWFVQLLARWSVGRLVVGSVGRLAGAWILTCSISPTVLPPVVTLFVKLTRWRPNPELTFGPPS